MSLESVAILIKVIDVSKHNGSIDWNKVKASGINGAILRCGYGDDIERQDDRSFKENADACTKLDIPFGAYLYSYATNADMAASEARHAIRLCKGYKLRYPLYFDAEEAGTESVAKQNAIIFCEAVKAEGYIPGVYANEYWWNHHLVGLDQYTKWVAKYNDNNGTPTTKPNVQNYDAWQYTSLGTCDGVTSRGLDISIFYRDFPSEINPSNSSPVPQPQPTPTPAPQPVKAVKQDLGNVNVYYSVYAGGKWWSEVANNSSWAGKGNNTAIRGLAIRVDNGSIKYRVHVRSGKWYDWITQCNINDKKNGFAGDLVNDIDAVEAVYLTPDGYNYKYLHYKVSVINNQNYYSEQIDDQKDNGMDGYAGSIGNSIDKIQMWIQ
ncbi:MAG: glycoside hydrolase family 25 protein [Turicibacter sp.]|nr:glycoside hydrolase family 25 protein [Turicibacter sp.]